MIRGTARSLARAVALLTLPLFTPVAQAQDEDPLYLSATNKLDYRRFNPEDELEEALRNRLEVTAQKGIFTAWLRLETLQMSDALAYDPFGVADPEISEEQRIDETNVTRRTFSIDTESLDARILDYSHVFGRGLALSVFEEEELNFDSRLEGGWARFSHDRGDVTALFGSNEGNRFRGIFLEPAPWNYFRTGASVVEGWGAEKDTNIRDLEHHYGVFGESYVGPLTLFAEYVYRDFPGRNGEGLELKNGYGAFGSALLAFWYVSITAEYRNFRKFEHDYHDPPTTLKEHTWTLLNRENGQVLSDIPDDDVEGYLGEVQFSPGLFTTFQAALGRLERDENDDEFWQAYGEAKTHVNEVVFVTAAASESEFRFGNIFDERIGGYGEVIAHWTQALSLTVGVEWSEIQESNSVTADYEFPLEYRERIFYASLGRSPWLNLTVTHEDTTEDDPSEPRNDWTMLTLELNLGSNHDLIASYGAEKAGWKCTGGICFFEPEFEGFKLRWVGRF